MQWRSMRGRVLPSFIRYNLPRRSCEKSIAKLKLSYFDSLNGGLVVNRRDHFRFMAQNRHPGLAAECTFLAIKQTSSGRRPRSPFDPLRTLGRRCEVYGL